MFPEQPSDTQRGGCPSFLPFKAIKPLGSDFDIIGRRIEPRQFTFIKIDGQPLIKPFVASWHIRILWLAMSNHLNYVQETDNVSPRKHYTKDLSALFSSMPPQLPSHLQGSSFYWKQSSCASSRAHLSKWTINNPISSPRSSLLAFRCWGASPNHTTARLPSFLQALTLAMFPWLPHASLTLTWKQSPSSKMHRGNSPHQSNKRHSDF